MKKVIGIRREDKNEWEGRAPLTPEAVQELKEKQGIHTIVQPSEIRTFSDAEYKNCGAEINEDLSEAEVIFAIKEIPKEMIAENKTYVFFSHTIKGQSFNMDMLQRLIDMKSNLIDYEKIMNKDNQRLLFFGKYAGLAGMIETLYAFGQKLKQMGFYTPFEKIKQAYQYASLQDAEEAIRRIALEIESDGFPTELSPLVVGFAGYGNVSQGAQEIFNLLPHKVISPHILSEMYENFTSDNSNLYKVVFMEEDLVRPKEGLFELQDYYDHPEKYDSVFENYIPYLDILVNCIFWTDKYPRLVTKKYLRDNTILKSNLTLKVVGDISCDINGSIEITHKATKPDNPCFTYFAENDRFEDGIQRNGVTVMAVDNLPCEFSRESSEYFSSVLKKFVNDIMQENFSRPFSELNLSYPLKKGLILLQGSFTDDYLYMKDFLNRRDE